MTKVIKTTPKYLFIQSLTLFVATAAAAATDQSSDWSPGHLAFYGRADLKQSDHRPVIAVIDIDVHQAEPDRRERVFKEVIQDLGPPDGTIVVKADDADNGFDDNFMMALLQDLSQIGEVILVRFVDDTIWVTFRDGQCALAAARKGRTQVCGQALKLVLKSPDWVGLIQREMDICSNDTIAQFSDYSPDSDPEDEGDEETMKRVFERLEVEPGYASGPPSGRASPCQSMPPPRPAPPARPPPMKSPAQERRRGPERPRAGVISVVQSDVTWRPPPPAPLAHQLHPFDDQRNDEVMGPDDDDETKRLSPESAIYEEIPEQVHFPAPNRPPPPLPQESASAMPPSVPPPLPHRQAPLPPPQHPPPGLPTAVPPPVPARTTGGPPIPARNPNH